MTKPAKGTFSHLVGLKHVEDWRAIGIVAFTFYLLLHRWNNFTLEESWGTFWGWFWFNSTFCWFCATIVHNSIHVPPFVHSFGNQIWQYALVLGYGYPVSTLIAGHNLSHHRFTQGPKDVMRTDKMRYSYNGLNLLLFVVSIVRSTTAQSIIYMNLAKKNKMPIYWQCKRETFFVILMNLTFCAANWRKYIHVILIPQILAKWGLISINLFQHDGCPKPEVDKYNFSRNFVDPVLNWFTCNNGYHTAHHLNPALHWSELKNFHDKRVKPNMNPCLGVDSLILFFFTHFIIPGGRTNWKGEPYVLPPAVEDESWVDSNFIKQTYSDGSSL